MEKEIIESLAISLVEGIELRVQGNQGGLSFQSKMLQTGWFGEIEIYFFPIQEAKKSKIKV